MTNHTLRLLASLGTLAALAASAASAVTVNFNSSADTYLRGNAGNNNYGALNSLLVGNHSSVGPFTGLFRFDLSSLPTSGITIDSVTLTLFSTANGSGTSVTLSVFQLAAANANWLEGTSNDTTPGAPGAATWGNLNYNSANPGNPTPWAGSPGARTAGTDYINTSLASFTGNASTIGTGAMAFTSTGSFSSTVLGSAGGQLNLWIGIPTVVLANDFFRIASKETTGTNRDPLLSVNYTAVPEPSAFAALAGLGALGLVTLRRRRRA
ncbi:MAG: DNRLRE domain-containing protein [Burkholderiales bacterium]|nr:DNRLRE domain-containing protein [Opitutaceae bacterium]